ncbi:MAG: endonuclease [Bacteroidales bacterium]|nr:endonuclease [Bacteroidales bacterium]MDD4383562.1 endonuclease [Bacteroidales bacterium]MDY0197305.1 endonuclease [Tenuifilaceae bacterium]
MNLLKASNRMVIPFTILLISLNLLSDGLLAQDRYRLMFYNVENLFDPFNDSLKNDDEFTAEGSRYWTWRKMTDKVNNIYKVITAVGEWEPPTMVGFCEIENRFVIERITKHTPLSKFDYQIVHRESPDARGIDVALIYRPDQFTVEEEHFFRVSFPDNPDRATRDILYARGIIGGLDTLHVFVNHWPSKYGGALVSEPGRIAAGKLVRQKVDSIKLFHPDARIIIMGDFNDTPDSRPLIEGLGASLPEKPFTADGLYNLHLPYVAKGEGTLKYQGAWEVIDMMIVTKGLLNAKHGVYTTPDGGKIFSADFLLEKDERFVGVIPFRTYIGFRYHGGFSDHLPIYIDLIPNR